MQAHGLHVNKYYFYQIIKEILNKEFSHEELQNAFQLYKITWPTLITIVMSLRNCDTSWKFFLKEMLKKFCIKIPRASNEI